MPYRCPLCLKHLGVSERLGRVCRNHPGQTVWIECADDMAVTSALKCPEPGCRTGNAPSAGLYLVHADCEAKSPFFDDTTVSPPPGEGISASFQSGTQNRWIFHWEIGMLRHVHSVVADEPGMWFPPALLAATGRGPARERDGVLVAVVGPQGAGKTVLAMQAMDEEGYVASVPQFRPRLDDYIYARRKGGDNPCLEALLLRYEMKHNANPFLLGGTLRQSGDIKAVFLKRANPAPDPPPSEAAPKSEQDSRWRRWGRTVKEAVENLDNDPYAESDAAEQSSGKAPAAWHAVVFYDTAGESMKLEDETIASLEQNADKIAIVVEAAEIFEGPQTGLALANATIDRIDTHDVECCIVITKLDTVFDKVPSELDHIRQLADDFSFDLTNDSAAHARELLQTWLTEPPSDTRSAFAARLGALPVFFVWNENMPRPGTRDLAPEADGGNPSNGAHGLQPKSHGLAKFILWCLGVERGRIESRS